MTYYPESLVRANSSTLSFLPSCFSSLLRLLRSLGSSLVLASSAGGDGTTGAESSALASVVVVVVVVSVCGVVVVSLLPVVELLSPSSQPGVPAIIIHFVS